MEAIQIEVVVTAKDEMTKQPDEDVRESNEEDELFAETEDDLGDLSGEETFDAMVVSTDWTTETLLSQILRGNLELDPIFQRRDAWDRRKKSRFIESLIVGLPVPQVVLAERKGRRGEFLVLDGKQRLLSIEQFARGDFKLSGLDLRKDLNRFSYEALPEAERLALDTQTIRTMVVRNWKREEFLYLVFLRLNTANVPLSPQELRQALHPGKFVAFVNDYTAENTDFASLMRRDGRPDFRMRDVELLVRFFAFTRFLPEYTGNLKDLFDFTCKSLNVEMAKDPSRVEAEAQQCLEGVRAVTSIFGRDAFRRWNLNQYERPFNRAVFDALMFYACDADIRAGMLDKSAEVIEAFKAACENLEFRESVTTTTKSTDSIYDRLSIWGASLSLLLGSAPAVPIPSRGVDGRIAYS
ncbi:DUF262 domain-containing protein [Nocardioides marinquilinus]|uniref:DUF262 domain-containing protein n=1 Tax=Nocardioides marinquilinus TaxID=1210400 RepID=UPI0031E96733